MFDLNENLQTINSVQIDVDLSKNDENLKTGKKNYILKNYNSYLDFFAELIIIIVSLSGIGFISFFNTLGFYLLVLVNILTILYFYRRKLYLMLLSQFIYIVLNLNGIYQAEFLGIKQCF